MNSLANSTEVARLYKDFSDSFTANDDDAVRRIYRELLHVGCPRAEIVDEALRLASKRQGGLPEPSLKEPIASANAMERFGDNERLAQFRAAAGLLSDVV